jgi:hypothetical protein
VPIYNEYGRWKRVVLGIPEIYPPFEIPEPMRQGMCRLGRHLRSLAGALRRTPPVPSLVRSRFLRERKALESTLKENGVVVMRPEAVMPLAGEFPGLIQMFARDRLFVVGHRVIVGHLRMKMREKEERGFGPILKGLGDSGHEVIKMPVAPGRFLEGVSPG